MVAVQLQLKNSHSVFEIANRGPSEIGHVAGGKAVFLLEGGYDLDALGESVAETFRALLGQPSMDSFDARLLQQEPTDRVNTVLREARRLHSL